MHGISEKWDARPGTHLIVGTGDPRSGTLKVGRETQDAGPILKVRPGAQTLGPVTWNPGSMDGSWHPEP